MSFRNQIRFFFTIVFVSNFLTLASSVSAQEQEQENSGKSIVFNTYGTIGIAKSSFKKPFYRSKNTATYGIDDDWTGVADNRLGVQVSANFNPNWSAVLHGIVLRNGDDEVKPTTIWAQLKWKYSDQTSVYLGRSLNTLFLNSEEFYVGYSQPWVRPPIELYAMGGENNFSDGINLQHQLSLGSNVLSVEAKAGVSSLTRKNYSVENKPIFGLSASFIRPDLTLRASMVQADVSVVSARLDPVIRLIKQQNPDVAKEYSFSDVNNQRYYSLGMRYEHQNWLLIMEVARTQLRRKSLPDQLGGYVTLGYAFGDWMPYISYSQLHILGSTTETRLTGQAAFVASAYLSAKKNDQKNLSLGLRWDLRPGLALKLQVDQVKPKVNEIGLFNGPLPVGQRNARVFSLMMDWAY
jgi:hypothetical protein